MARFFRPAALAPLALLLGQLLPGTVRADDPPPVEVYGITGVMDSQHPRNLSLSLTSNDFDYGAFQQMEALVQGAVQASTAATTPNTILLRLPMPGASANPEDAIRELVGRFNYLGPADVNDPGSALLGMYGLVEGVAPAPGQPPADLNFFLFVNPIEQTVEGSVVLGDIFYKFETVEGEVIITAFPFEVGLCRLEAPDARPQPGPGHSKPSWKDMTKEERRAHKQDVKKQRKIARDAKRGDAKRAREEKREQKRARKGKDRLLAAQPAPLEEEAHDHAHDYPHDDHHMAMAMHRQLQASRLLVFLDFAPLDGVYSYWNGGNFISISQCNLPQSEIDQAVAGTREDFAPFNIEVTTDRAFYNSQGGRKVAVNVVRGATSVLNGWCGLAYLNSLDWAGNTVWTSCECLLQQIAQLNAHEVGHIFGLGHDGRTDPEEQYLFGFPGWGVLPDHRRWNTIMGGIAPVGIDQWSKGEYTNANNGEDDIKIITDALGAHVSDTAACTKTFIYRDLSRLGSNTVVTSPTATITCAGGAHSYPVRIRRRYKLNVAVPIHGNMKFQVAIARAQLRNGQWVPSSSFTNLGSNDAYSSGGFTYTSASSLQVGNYMVRILSIAEPGSSNTYAFPVYGSIGSYTLSITNGI